MAVPYGIDQKQTTLTDKLNLAFITYRVVIFRPLQHIL